MKNFLHKIISVFISHILFGISLNAQDWQWAVGSKGYQFDYANNIVTDSKGNVYISGYFTSPNFSFGSLKISNRGNEDGFLAKFDEYGNCIWLIGFGGEENDRPSSMAIYNDTLFVVGYTESKPAYFGDKQISATQGSDIFFAVVSTKDGSVLRLYSFAGDGYEDALTIFALSSKDIYIGGEFSGKTFNLGDYQLKNFNYDSQYQGLSDGFIARINSNGQVFWALSFGGVGNDRINRIIATQSIPSAPINIYFLGTYNSNKIGVGKDTLVNWGYSDVFLGKMNEALVGLKETPNVLWGRAISGTDKEYPTDLAFDFNGLLCVAGEFQSPSLKFGNIEIVNKGSYDIFFAKYDGDGNPYIAFSIGGEADDYAKRIIPDNKGNIYLGGYFASSSLAFDTIVVYNRTASQAFSDVYVAKLNIDNKFVWVRTAGGDKEDQSFAIAVDAQDNVYQTGNFESKDMFFKSFDLFNYGYSNVFLAKINPKLIADVPDVNSDGIVLSPNPCQKFLTIEVNQSKKASDVEIFDIIGRKVIAHNLHKGNVISLEAIPSGLYFLRYSSRIFPFVKE